MTTENNTLKVAQTQEGYRAAIQMISYEGQLLTANVFIVALIGAVLKFYPELNFLAKLLPVLGAAICVTWILITMRQFDYYRYWFAWARELEKVGLAPASKMLAEGQRFSSGEGVTVDGDTIRMRWGSRLFKIQWLIYVVVIMFGIVYVLLFFSP